MGTYILTASEASLFEAIQHGDQFETGIEGEDCEIRAEVLQHIILGLPVVERKGLLHAVGSWLGVSSRERTCRVASVGFRLKGGIIVGRLVLDGVIGLQGGPLPAMRFEETRFEQGPRLDVGFSGAHAHFSRLSFDGCRFGDSPGHAEPTINLAGARLDRGLRLRSLAPRQPGGLLWIRARNARIAGPLDLSGSQLRSPEDDKDRRASEPPVVAIDLHRATIEGDLLFLAAASYGQIHALGVHVRGDIVMEETQIEVDDAQEYGLVLQSAVVDGMAIFYNDADAASDRKAGGRSFLCSAGIMLRAAEIGDDLHIETNRLGGDLNCLDLTVGNDLLLYASIDRKLDLSGCRIGGSLDLSRLQIRHEHGELLLNNGAVTRNLRLVRDDFTGEADSPIPRSDFRMTGEIDLRGFSCGTLEDDVGDLWGDSVWIKMYNFIYRQTGSRPEDRKKRRSDRIVGDWVSRRRADGLWPWSWLPKGWLSGGDDFWETWQKRRNWVYRQYEDAVAPASTQDRPPISRYKVSEDKYRPQPFEQAIRVARAEGRDDFATHFEILKQRLEWRFFNEKARWGLSIVGMILAALWLMAKRNSLEWVGWTALCLIVTLIAIINTSRVHNFWKALLPHESLDDGTLKPRGIVADVAGRAATWATYFFAPFLLYLHGWQHEPFYFLVALVIFGSVRLLSVFAHGVMRIGFGYLRRPLHAICTLLAAFLLGWWGVRVANDNRMLVVDTEPVAALVAPDSPPREGERATALYMGSEIAGARSFIRDVPCGHLISEPLYALDTLIPLLDLREESRCEVRRHPEHNKRPPSPAEMRGLWGVVTALPDLTVHNNAFWHGMKVLYAIAGWFIVSLSILTFAQVNRAHAEPPTEHR